MPVQFFAPLLVSPQLHIWPCGHSHLKLVSSARLVNFLKAAYTGRRSRVSCLLLQCLTNNAKLHPVATCARYRQLYYMVGHHPPRSLVLTPSRLFGHPSKNAHPLSRSHQGCRLIFHASSRFSDRFMELFF